jgi:hypothetical protein
MVGQHGADGKGRPHPQYCDMQQDYSDSAAYQRTKLLFDKSTTGFNPQEISCLQELKL